MALPREGLGEQRPQPAPELTTKQQAALEQLRLAGTAIEASELARLAGCAAEETREYGIAVFSIDPGLVRTPMTEAIMTTPAGQKWMPGVRDEAAR